MSEKLKPCPFCGSEAHVHKHVLSPDFFTIDCSNSKCILLNIVTFHTEEDAIKAWNTRAEEQS